MFKVVLLMALAISSLTHAKVEIAKNLGQCFSARSLKQEVAQDQEMRRRLQVPDLKLRLNGGYSNNEISNQNPERLQLGGTIRWDDITDRQRRIESLETQSESKLLESKLLLENYWRSELENTYYWKWGRTLRPLARALLTYATEKLAAGRGSLASLATSRTYSDLVELGQVSGEFLARIDALNNKFGGCAELATWPLALDFTAEEMVEAGAKKSLRLELADASCSARKKSRSISLLNESGTWTVSAASSFNRNRQLGGDENTFNDVRAGLEVNIPMNFSESYEVSVDRCDYESRIIANEDQVEAGQGTTTYPLLATLVGQFTELRAKAELLTSNGETITVGGSDIVLLGLNLFRLHRSLMAGEAKLNARILPAQIVVHEL